MPLPRASILAGAALTTAIGDLVTSIVPHIFDSRPNSIGVLFARRQSDVGKGADYGVVLILGLSRAVPVGHGR